MEPAHEAVLRLDGRKHLVLDTTRVEQDERSRMGLNVLPLLCHVIRFLHARPTKCTQLPAVSARPTPSGGREVANEADCSSAALLIGFPGLWIGLDFLSVIVHMPTIETSRRIVNVMQLHLRQQRTSRRCSQMLPHTIGSSSWVAILGRSQDVLSTTAATTASRIEQAGCHERVYVSSQVVYEPTRREVALSVHVTIAEAVNRSYFKDWCCAAACNPKHSQSQCTARHVASAIAEKKTLSVAAVTQRSTMESNLGSQHAGRPAIR
eukprot:scaffold13253_cov140-Isochrysis_galbana.AAC.6